MTMPLSPSRLHWSFITVHWISTGPSDLTMSGSGATVMPLPQPAGRTMTTLHGDLVQAAACADAEDGARANTAAAIAAWIGFMARSLVVGRCCARGRPAGRLAYPTPVIQKP